MLMLLCYTSSLFSGSGWFSVKRQSRHNDGLPRVFFGLFPSPAVSPADPEACKGVSEADVPPCSGRNDPSLKLL